MFSKKRSAARTGPASSKRAKIGTSANVLATVPKGIRSRVEVKRLVERTGGAGITLNTSWSNPFEMPTPAVGDSSESRDGRVIKVLGYDIRINAKNSVIPVQPSSNLRVVLVRTKGAITETPLAADIFYPGLAGLQINALYNVNYSDTYQILFDRTYNFTSPLYDTGNNVILPITKCIRINKAVNFQQSFYTGAGGDSVNTSVFLFMVSDNANMFVEISSGTAFVDV